MVTRDEQYSWAETLQTMYDVSRYTVEPCQFLWFLLVITTDTDDVTTDYHVVDGDFVDLPVSYHFVNEFGVLVDVIDDSYMEWCFCCACYFAHWFSEIVTYEM